MKQWLKKILTNKPEIKDCIPMLDNIGCFGKLPIHPEFLRIGIDNIASHRVERWLQQSFTAISRIKQAEGKAECGLQHGFLITTAPNEPAMTGCLYDSNDKYGRGYPFVVFRQIGASAQNIALIPAAVNSFLNAAKRLCQHQWQSDDTPVNLQRQVEGLPKLPPLTENEALQRSAFEASSQLSLQQCWQAFPDSSVDIGDLFYTLDQQLNQLSSMQAYKILIPLSPIGIGVQVSCWLRMLNHTENPHRGTWQAFWKMTEQRAELHLYHGQLAQDIFFDLLGHRPKPCVDILAQRQSMPTEIRNKFTIGKQSSLIDACFQWEKCRAEVNYA